MVFAAHEGDILALFLFPGLYLNRLAIEEIFANALGVKWTRLDPAIRTLAFFAFENDTMSLIRGELPKFLSALSALGRPKKLSDRRPPSTQRCERPCHLAPSRTLAPSAEAFGYQLDRLRLLDRKSPKCQPESVTAYIPDCCFHKGLDADTCDKFLGLPALDQILNSWRTPLSPTRFPVYLREQ